MVSFNCHSVFYPNKTFLALKSFWVVGLRPCLHIISRIRLTFPGCEWVACLDLYNETIKSSTWGLIHIKELASRTRNIWRLETNCGRKDTWGPKLIDSKQLFDVIVQVLSKSCIIQQPTGLSRSVWKQMAMTSDFGHYWFIPYKYNEKLTTLSCFYF